MAGRGFGAGPLAEINKAKNAPAHLFELRLDSGTVYITDAYRPVLWNGNTYSALGYFLGFDAIKETAELVVSQVQVTLAGVDQVLVAAVLNQEYLDRRLLIYKAFFADDTQQLVVDPGAIFDGRVSEVAIVDNPVDGTSSVVVEASSHWADFERRPGRHTNHAEQQLYFSGDLGFEYVSEILSLIHI